MAMNALYTRSNHNTKTEDSNSIKSSLSQNDRLVNSKSSPKI